MAPDERDGDTQYPEVGTLTTRRHLGRVCAPLCAVNRRTGEAPRRPRLTSVRKAVTSMGVIDEKSFTRECVTRCLRALDDRLNVVPFATCDDCLQNVENLDLILYHLHEDVPKLHNSNQNIISFKELLNILPVIILSDIDSPDSLLEIFESGARGFIPTVNTTLEQAIEIIGFVKAGGVFAPLGNLSLRRTKWRGIPAGPVSSNQFTPSELAILDQLKLGKANKVIAHELGVSESTVKVHIGRMMKKLKVTNRTQIVTRAYALAAAGTPCTGQV